MLNVAEILHFKGRFSHLREYLTEQQNSQVRIHMPFSLCFMFLIRVSQRGKMKSIQKMRKYLGLD